MAMKEVRNLMTSLQGEEYEEADDGAAPTEDMVVDTDVNQPAGADMEVEDPLHGGVPGPKIVYGSRSLREKT